MLLVIDHPILIGTKSRPFVGASNKPGNEGTVRVTTEAKDSIQWTLQTETRNVREKDRKSIFP
jgi:hypothetical protein